MWRRSRACGAAIACGSSPSAAASSATARSGSRCATAMTSTTPGQTRRPADRCCTRSHRPGDRRRGPAAPGRPQRRARALSAGGCGRRGTREQAPLLPPGLCGRCPCRACSRARRAALRSGRRRAGSAVERATCRPLLSQAGSRGVAEQAACGRSRRVPHRDKSRLPAWEDCYRAKAVKNCARHRPWFSVWRCMLPSSGGYAGMRWCLASAAPASDTYAAHLPSAALCQRVRYSKAACCALHAAVLPSGHVMFWCESRAPCV